MFDCEIVLPGEYPEKATQIPAAGEARVEGECAIDQPHHGTDVLAQIRQHNGGISEDARIVLPELERPPGKIDALLSIIIGRFGPALSDEPQVADCRPGQCGPVMWIDRDRLL